MLVLVVGRRVVEVEVAVLYVVGRRVAVVVGVVVLLVVLVVLVVVLVEVLVVGRWYRL